VLRFGNVYSTNCALFLTFVTHVYTTCYLSDRSVFPDLHQFGLVPKSHFSVLLQVTVVVVVVVNYLATTVSLLQVTIVVVVVTVEESACMLLPSQEVFSEHS